MRIFGVPVHELAGELVIALVAVGLIYLILRAQKADPDSQPHH